ncbi:PST family polysaccharide transporter [Flavobacterium sp. CG_9.1]|uniref:O-antigen translocase n=1 Tax=Flavobacterium sp. CG_9.1 TaxID=2787728 RepID=UPI0018CBE397|nr:O-antigen translocase [Flavobacterium sp. CG_9.1]MBG6061088.1 PST family polysaccharide transporter [Flavobacterium sp. CG_9.1]
MLKTIKQNPLLKVISLNSISVVVSFMLGIVSTKIISIYLGTSGMALLGNFRNFTTMMKSMATLGINNSFIKVFVENKEDKNELGVIYSTFFWFFLFVSVGLGLIILVFSNVISEFLFLTISFAYPIRFFGLLLPLLVINTFWIAIYTALEKYKKIVILQIVSNLLIFSLTTFLIVNNAINGGLLAIALSELVAVVVTFVFIIKDSSYFQFSLQKIIAKKYLDTIKSFSSMALLSAILTPVTLLLIRSFIIKTHSIQEAGIWDATNKFSSFYMLVFSSGLSLYYLPKLSSLKTEEEFKLELKSYFRVFVPLFFAVLLLVFLLKGFILDLAFTKSFLKVKDVLIWQLLGDFLRIMTLAFGYQIVVKARVKKYFILEIVFNVSYLIVSFYLISRFSFQGALMAYFIANLILFLLILFMFRKLFFISKRPNID